MSKKERQLKRLIEEEVRKVLSEQEAAGSAPFGKYLWADPVPLGNQKERIRKDDIKEPNSEEEEAFFKAIVNHVEMGSSKHLASLIPSLLKPMKQKGEYSKYLNPPKGPLYRGIIVKPDLASKILGVSVEEIQEDSKHVRHVEKRGVLPKMNYVMSWSTNPDVALNFIQDIKKDYVSVLLVAYPADGGDFYLNPNNLLKKFDLMKVSPYFSEEMEVISYGAVPFREAYYYNMFDKTLGSPLSDPEIKAMAKHLVEDMQEKLATAIAVEQVDKNQINLVLIQVVDEFMDELLKEVPFYRNVSKQDLFQIKQNLVATITNYGKSHLYKILRDPTQDKEEVLGRLDFAIEKERWEHMVALYLTSLTTTAVSSNERKALKYDRLTDAFREALGGKE